MGFNFTGFFIYVLSAPVFLMTHLGLSEREFGWLFIPGVVGMMSGSALSARLAGRLSQTRTVALGYAVMALACALNVGVSLLLAPGIPVSVLPVMVYNFGMAVAMPSLTLLALEYFPANRGLAASCQSFLQMMTSAVSASLVAPALWRTVPGLAFGMLGFMALGLVGVALWTRLQAPKPGA